MDKVDVIKNPSSPIFFFIERKYFDQKLLGNPIKMVPMLYNDDFLHKIVVFIVKKVNEEEIVIFCPHFQY